MSRNLTIDCGNTTTKAAVWEGDTLLWQNVFPQFSCARLDKIIRVMNPGAAIVCSVRDDGSTLENHLRKAGCPAVINLSYRTPMPVTIGYATPETLGVDRIAAAVGAHAIAPGSDVLIADIGTAATYDVLTADSVFIGGNIAPGIGMRLRALNRFTARLPLIDSKGDTPLFGNSTDTALRSGAVNGVVAEIIYYLERLAPGARLLLTGGWAPDVALRIPQLNPQTVPMLVSIGLNRILSYNENL